MRRGQETQIREQLRLEQEREAEEAKWKLADAEYRYWATRNT